MDRLEVILVERNPAAESKPVSLKFTPIFGALARIFCQDMILSELYFEDGIERIRPIGLYDPRVESQVLVHDSYGHTEIIALRQVEDDYRDEITRHVVSCGGTVVRYRYRISREQLDSVT